MYFDVVHPIRVDRDRVPSTQYYVVERRRIIARFCLSFLRTVLIRNYKILFDEKKYLISRYLFIHLFIYLKTAPIFLTLLPFLSNFFVTTEKKKRKDKKYPPHFQPFRTQRCINCTLCSIKPGIVLDRRGDRGGKKKGGEKKRATRGEGGRREWLALLPTEAKFSTLLKAVSRGRDSAEFSYLEEGCN